LNGVIKSSSQIYCCHGRMALSKTYNYYQLGTAVRKKGRGEERHRAPVDGIVLQLHHQLVHLFQVPGSGFRVDGSGFRGSGLGFRGF